MSLHRPIAAFLFGLILLSTGTTFASDVVIKEDENQGVKGLVATFAVDQSRDIVFKTLNDVGGFKRIFPNILEVKVVREEENSRDVFFRVDAVLSEASYTLRRVHSRGESADIIVWNRISGDANVIRGSWTLVDGDKPGSTKVTYRSYVDVATLIPTSAVRDIAIGKVREMVKRVRKACNQRASKVKTTSQP